MFNEELLRLNYRNLDSMYKIRKYAPQEYGILPDIEVPHIGQMIFFQDKKVKRFYFYTYSFSDESKPRAETFSPGIRNFITKLFNYTEDRQRDRIQPNAFYEARRLILNELIKYHIPGATYQKSRVRFLPPTMKKHSNRKPSIQ